MINETKKIPHKQKVCYVKFGLKDNAGGKLKEMRLRAVGFLVKTAQSEIVFHIKYKHGDVEARAKLIAELRGSHDVAFFLSVEPVFLLILLFQNDTCLCNQVNFDAVVHPHFKQGFFDGNTTENKGNAIGMIAESEFFKRDIIAHLRRKNAIFQKYLRPQVVHLHLREYFLAADSEKDATLKSGGHIALIDVAVFEIVGVDAGLCAQLKADARAGCEQLRLCRQRERERQQYIANPLFHFKVVYLLRNGIRCVPDWFPEMFSCGQRRGIRSSSCHCTGKSRRASLSRRTGCRCFPCAPSS